MHRTLHLVLPPLTAIALLAAGGLAVGRWVGSGGAGHLAMRLPEADPGAAAATTGGPVDLRGTFLKGPGAPSSIAAAWPRFRGAGFDNIGRDAIPLAETWPASGPPERWAVDLGEGYAGPTVRHGCVYLLDYDETRHADTLRCLSLDDGREIWRRSYRNEMKRNHGFSRTVPAVSERHVVTVGPRGHVLCADARTGDFKWGMDLVRDHGAKEPLWYTGQCPLIDGDVAVIAPAGKALLMGVDCESGKVVWEAPNPDHWEMSHSSVVPMTFAGRRMYVYAARGGIAGVAADGPDRGAILWRSTEWNNSITSPMPVPLPDGRIFLTAGYGAGSLILRLVASAGGAIAVETGPRIAKTVFACEQHTPILLDGLLYSVLPADAGELKRQLVCYDPAGQTVWTSGPSERFGLGPFLVAADRILVMNEDGQLTMARASKRGWEPLARAQVLHGREAWAPMAVVDGLLLARDSKRMVCLDLRAGTPPAAKGGATP